MVGFFKKKHRTLKYLFFYVIKQRTQTRLILKKSLKFVLLQQLIKKGITLQNPVI